MRLMMAWNLVLITIRPGCYTPHILRTVTPSSGTLLRTQCDRDSICAPPFVTVQCPCSLRCASRACPGPRRLGHMMPCESRQQSPCPRMSTWPVPELVMARCEFARLPSLDNSTHLVSSGDVTQQRALITPLWRPARTTSLLTPFDRSRSAPFQSRTTGYVKNKPSMCFLDTDI